jgi:citrate lyase subunit beta-like protein
MVHINYKDIDGLIRETKEGVEMGFAGKQAIHPNQIQPIYQAFAPR